MYAGPVKVGYEDYADAPMFFKSFIAKGENSLFWLNGGKYYREPGTQITDKQMLPFLRPGNQETWGESAKLGSRPISPYMAEAVPIYTFMMGIEGFYYWDSRNYSAPAGTGREGKPQGEDSLGDIEFAIKGMHRVSQFNQLFEGNYFFIRPVRHYDTHDRDHPIIRGILNGRYLVLAMTNPYLDPDEQQKVEIWYDTPYENRKSAPWANEVTIQPRKTHLFQCKLPALPSNQAYEPEKLYFHYLLKDGKYSKTFNVTGNYDVPYPFAK